MDGRAKDGRATIWLRALRVATLAFAICLFAAFGAGAASAATVPPQGTFENCNLDTQMQTCIQRLEAMHQGGLQVVAIGASTTSLSSLSTYAAAAHSLGMSVMWELSGPFWWQDPSTSTSEAGQFSSFATACGCQENGALLAYTIQWLASQPGTYGYYAADDSVLEPGDDAAVEHYVAEIKQQDPAHTVIIGSADESQTQQYQSIPDAIGTEIYPVTNTSLLPVAANQDMWGGVAQEATDAQQFADRAGKQSAFILQAFTWGDNLSDGEAIGVCSPSDTQASCYGQLQYPSSAAQLELRNEVLVHAHPKLIMWWSFMGTYGDVTGDTYSIYPAGAVAAARWSGLEAAIQAPYPGAQGAASPPNRHSIQKPADAVRARIAVASHRRYGPRRRRQTRAVRHWHELPF